MRLSRYRAGNRRNDGNSQRSYKRGGEIEQGLRLAVDPVQHLGLIVAESGGGLQPVHAQLGVDAVEYGQWKTHIRQEGLIFSGGSVGTKVGSGLTSAALTGLLSYVGYVASSSGAVAQSQDVINMIVSIYEWGPIFVWAVLLLILFFYKLDKVYPQIMRDLIAREAKGEL